MVGFSNENGFIKYSDEVLGKIVGLSTMECYGVVGMVSKKASDGFWELIRVENLSKGVKITLAEDDKLNIEIILLVEAAHLRKPPRVISIRYEDNLLVGVGGYSVSAQPVEQVCSTL